VRPPGQYEAVWAPIEPISRPAAELTWFRSATEPDRVLPTASQTIRYWPAVIEHIQYSPSASASDGRPGPSSSPSTSLAGSHWTYRVNFLRLHGNDRARLEYREEELLPYLAYEADPETTNSVRVGLSHLNDYPTLKDVAFEEIRDDWNRAVLYYAAALNCADTMSEGQCRCLEVCCVGSIDLTTPRSPCTGWVFTNPYKATPDEDDPPTDQWYQGLWWGAERIWSGDLVRLIATHSQLDLPIAHTADDKGLYPSRGDPAGPLFLLIDGMFIDPSSEKGSEQGLIKGRVYELVDASTNGTDALAPMELNGSGAIRMGEPGPSIVRSPTVKPPNSPPFAACPLSTSAAITSLPAPPAGKSFRLLHPPAIKLTFPMAAVLAGRYYPRATKRLSVEAEAVARFMDILGGGDSQVHAEAGDLRVYGGVFMGAQKMKTSRFEMLTDGRQHDDDVIRETWKT
jgi:hypothetical protein